MAEPSTVNVTDGMGIFEWECPRVRIVLDRLYEQSRSRGAGVGGYLVVRSLLPEHAGRRNRLLDTQLTLTNDTSRQRAAKALEPSTSFFKGMQETEWLSMIRLACYDTLEAWGVGNPLEKLTDSMFLDSEAKWLLHPFLLEGQVNMMFGAGQSGKSTFGMALALTLDQNSSQFLGLKPTKEMRVAYLDWETNSRIQGPIGRRIITPFATDIEIPNIHVMYKRLFRPLYHLGDKLREELATHKIDMVIFDSATRAAGGDLNDSAVATQFADAVTKMVEDRTVLVLAHTDRKGDKDKPMGSVVWWDWPRLVWKLTKLGGEYSEQGGYIDVGLTATKGNYTGLPQPRRYTIQFDKAADTIRFSKEDPSRVTMLSKQMSLRQRIWWALRDRAQTVNELAEELEADAGQIRTRLNQRRGKEFAVVANENGDQRWGLMEQRF